MISGLFLILAFRSTLLALFEKKSVFYRVLEGLAGTYCLALFLVLPKEFHGPFFLITSTLLGFSLYRRFKHKKPASIQSWIGLGCVYTLGGFVVLATLFFRLTEDRKVAKVILTGESKPLWVEWKNPANVQNEAAWMESYEVVLQDTQGKEISRQWIYGDLVGLRAEVMTFPWSMKLLGLTNLAHLDTVYNGYKTAQRHNLFPHAAEKLSFQSALLQSLWHQLYHTDWKLPGVERASLESVYLPLQTADLQPNMGSYWVVVGNSGLTAQASVD